MRARTPQIDALIIDEEVSHELMTSSEGASYVPYPCGHVICEVKNSTKAAKGHLDQIAAIDSSIMEMAKRSATRRTSAGGPVFHHPLSILLIAYSTNARVADFKKWFNNSRRSPNYTILLDRGLLIASRPQILTVPQLDFCDYRRHGEWAICEPTISNSYRRGVALMWLYFSIVAYINWTVKGNISPILEFTNDTQMQYPMMPKAILSTATAW